MNSAAHSLNVAIFFAVLFLIVSHPLTYKLIHRVFKPFFAVADKAGCATMQGLLLHTVVFGVVVFLISYFFGSSRLEMMTDMPTTTQMAIPMTDAMGTPSAEETEQEEDANAGFATPNSTMQMPEVYEKTTPLGNLAMGPNNDYESAPVSNAPTGGLPLPMDQSMEEPVAAEGFSGYASVF